MSVVWRNRKSAGPLERFYPDAISPISHFIINRVAFRVWRPASRQLSSRASAFCTTDAHTHTHTHIIIINTYQYLSSHACTHARMHTHTHHHRTNTRQKCIALNTCALAGYFTIAGVMSHEWTSHAQVSSLTHMRKHARQYRINHITLYWLRCLTRGLHTRTHTHAHRTRTIAACTNTRTHAQTQCTRTH
jgi:hypothetical protein